ncbi:hypothetical protein CGUA_12840 [Corynebacterium guangdongense]|nr:hypothetical protein CGUA_12840 [Corynebacterium guangdongense]
MLLQPAICYNVQVFAVLHNGAMDLLELRARRLIAQHLSPAVARPTPADPRTAVRSMGAVQGQTYPAGIRGLSLRWAGPHDENDSAVHDAIEAGLIVRCWPMRGTLHFVPAEDARWMMRLGNPPVERAAARRRPGLGLSPEDVDTARRALHAALADGPLTRPEVYAVFTAAGVDPGDNRGPHLLRALGGEGEVVQGPKRGRDETFLLVDSLPVESVELGRAESLALLAARYVDSHGPVTADDFRWWTGLGKREAGAALAAVPGAIAVDGFHMGAWQADVTAGEIEQALATEYRLPAFDEYLLGYHDKSFALADALRPQVLTKNGISWNFLVGHGGEVTGRDLG